jgi:CRP-like cAMP-binding protein
MQDRILLLAKNAQERVVEFLYDMEKRTSAKDCVELPLLRQDIADYLGLTIETVSTHIKLFRILRCNQESERTTNSSV